MTPGDIDEKSRGGNKFKNLTDEFRVECGQERYMAVCHVTVEC